jgi:hypothetical protein
MLFPVVRERQICPRGQQNGLPTPGGGMLRPGLFSATWPGGQQSAGCLL